MINYAATHEWPYHVSAGAVVMRRAANQAEVLLLKRNTEPDGSPGGYHLPKGTVESGEALEATAIRELEEEAAVSITVNAYLGATFVSFENHDGRHMEKTTHFFLAELQSEIDGRQMDDEHDSKEWMPIDAAKKKLEVMPAGEEEIIKRAEEYTKKVTNEHTSQ